MPGHDPILFDLGTGVRYFGEAWPADKQFHGTCLLSHFHWDHIQGLPFFPPMLRPGSSLNIFAPEQPDGLSPSEVMESTLCPPLFPVGIRDLPSEVTFNAVGHTDFNVGQVEVMSRLIPHKGNTCGYRIEWSGATVAYLSDHQQPGVDTYAATPAARELCEGVDLLIHDAQYTRDDFERKRDWGHCTVDYAVWIARECGVKTLALFHHDPTHTDDQIDLIVAEANELAGPDVNVIAAREKLTLRIPG